MRALTRKCPPESRRSTGYWYFDLAWLSACCSLGNLLAMPILFKTLLRRIMAFASALILVRSTKCLSCPVLLGRLWCTKRIVRQTLLMKQADASTFFSKVSFIGWEQFSKVKKSSSAEEKPVKAILNASDWALFQTHRHERQERNEPDWLFCLAVVSLLIICARFLVPISGLQTPLSFPARYYHKFI